MLKKESERKILCTFLKNPIFIHKILYKVQTFVEHLFFAKIFLQLQKFDTQKVKHVIFFSFNDYTHFLNFS